MKKINFNLNSKFLNNLREKTENEAKKTRVNSGDNVGANLKKMPKLAILLASSVFIFAIIMFIISIKFL